MEQYSEKNPSVIIMSAVVYLLVLATVAATLSEEIVQENIPTPIDRLYGLGTWTHQPMYVDEPQWILLAHGRPGRTNSKEQNDERFFVARGKKRKLSMYPGRTGLFTESFGEGGDAVYSDAFRDLSGGFWVDRGKKRINSLLESTSDPFWVNGGNRQPAYGVITMEPYWANRGKRGDVTQSLDKDHFWVNRGKRSVHKNDDKPGHSERIDIDGVKEKRVEIDGKILDKKSEQKEVHKTDKRKATPSPIKSGDSSPKTEGKAAKKRKKRTPTQETVQLDKKGGVETALNKDPFWVNRGKKGDLKNMLNNEDQFWVNRGKRGELESALKSGEKFWVNRGKKSELQSLLEGGGDQFWVNRGKKSELQSLLEGGDQFWVNRGKKSELQSLLESGDRFWVNRGKKSELESALNGGDQFWVNRGKKSELQSALNGGDQFWVNRGKKGELQSALNGGDQFWVNRGKKSELQSALNGGDQFWVNRGKKGELQSALNGGDQFWVNRGKKSELESALNGGDQFWVNRGKKSELQSALNGGDQFWVNRGKKSELESALNGGDKFWVNRGKKSELQSALEAGDQFWVNRGKKGDLQQALDGGDAFWVNRGKKGELQSVLNGGDQFWVNRGKKSELQSALNGGDQFWVNRGKKSELESALNGGDKFWVNRGKKSELQSALEAGDQFWVNRGKKGDLQEALDGGDAFWVNRGKKGELQSVLNGGDQFWVNRGKKGELQSLLEGDQFWVNRGKKGDLTSALTRDDQFWVNRGKKSELQSLLESGDQFWVNRGKKNELQPVLNLGDQFWVNRGKKSELQTLLDGNDQFWVNRGRRAELQSLLGGSDQFWVNRGKRNDVLNGGGTFWVNRGKKNSQISTTEPFDEWKMYPQSERNRSEIQLSLPLWRNPNFEGGSPYSRFESSESFFTKYLSPLSGVQPSDSHSNDRLKKDPFREIFEADPFWVNRGKRDQYANQIQDESSKGESTSEEKQNTDANNSATQKSRRKRRTTDNDAGDKLVPDKLPVRNKRESPADRQRSLYQWFGRGKKENQVDPFWVSRGKRSETQTRKRRDLGTSSTALPPTIPPQANPSTSRSSPPDTKSARQKRRARMVEIEIQKPSSFPSSPSLGDNSDYLFKKDTDLNSLNKWWQEGRIWPGFDVEASGSEENSSEVSDEEVLGDALTFREVGEKINPRLEPFWVNRGKRTDVHVPGSSIDTLRHELREKKLGTGTLFTSEGRPDTDGFGGLTPGGETFWVARG